MERYLLFDSGCRACTNIAQAVEKESSNWLMARSLRDLEMQTLLAQADPAWKWTPTILEREGDHIRIFTGWRLQLKLLRKIGFSRSLRLLTVVTQNSVPATSQSRRDMLKTGGLVLAGLAFGTNLWSKNAQAMDKKEPDQPGSLPRSEGVISYTLIERGGDENSIRIHFNHTDPGQSGIVEAIGRQAKEVELRLIRGEEILALILNRYEPEFRIKEKGGRNARFTLSDKEWKSDKEDSTDIIAANKTNIAVMCSIYSEFEVIPEAISDPIEAPSSDATTPTLRSCPCSFGSNRVRGTSGVFTFRSEACAAATTDMNRRCTNRWCIGCCDRLECDCVCLGSPLGIDYVCSCGRIGYFCTGQCV